MADYTLRLRRYSPETGEAPYWEDFEVDLDGHRSVLDGILQAKDRTDASIGIRCSCRAAICGSCGVRINGKPNLACHMHLDHAAENALDGVIIGRADGQHARDQGPDRRHGRGPLEEDAARHAVAAARGRGARARVHRAARVDDRRHADDGLHPVRRLRVGLPLDGGRPALHRPRGARQGLPLRRRPARRPAVRAPQGPRRGPARDLRLHALLQLHRGVPQGRRADEPDHAPAPDRRRRPRDRRPQQRPPPRAGVRREHRAQRAAARGRPAARLLRRQVPPARRARAGRLAARDPEGAAHAAR